MLNTTILDLITKQYVISELFFRSTVAWHLSFFLHVSFILSTNRKLSSEQVDAWIQGCSKLNLEMMVLDEYLSFYWMKC